MEFQTLLYNKAKQAVLDIPDIVLQDIYSLSFYYWAYADDQRKPRLTIGYNTNARRASCTPKPGQKPRWPIASSSDEAKWNYAFWLQDEATTCVFGESDSDQDEITHWIRSLNLWYSDEDEQVNFEQTLKLGGKAFRLFIDLCSRTAMMLHAEGVIADRFGREVPIIVHELEYYDLVYSATRKANPPGLVSEFLAWMDSMW